MKTRNLSAIIDLGRRDAIVNSALRQASLSVERFGSDVQIFDLKAYAEAMELAVIALAAGNEALTKSLVEIHSRMPFHLAMVPQP